MSQTATSIDIRNLTLKYGAVNVLENLDLEINDGEFLVLLGPSGCGKSTLLNCIAGLTEATDGQIFIKDRNVTWAEPSERGIGMVFQSYALYPQMKVRDNLAFGLQNARVPKPEIERRVAEASRILQIEPLLDRKPAQLSGGQRQRVAIGRALVRDVDVFLFDEPLSNLDAKLRTALRVEIKRLHQNLTTTMIYVTHDQVEAMTLADRIAIMKNGKIQQLGAPDEIYERPVNVYVADFIGNPSMNFINGTLDGGTFTSGEFTLPMDGYAFRMQDTSERKAILGIRPEHVVTGQAVKFARFRTEVIVDIVEPMGSDTLVWVTIEGKPFCIRLDGTTRVATGERLSIGIDPARTSLFDAGSEERL